MGGTRASEEGAGPEGQPSLRAELRVTEGMEGEVVPFQVAQEVGLAALGRRMGRRQMVALEPHWEGGVLCTPRGA